jgi:spore germination protein
LHLYLVKPGDSLAELARRYRVTADTLVRRNALPSSSWLLPGLSLAIPAEPEGSTGHGFFTYEVRAGDTARGLSERWGLPLTWLALGNGWRDTNLEPGDILLVPPVPAADGVDPNMLEKRGVLSRLTEDVPALGLLCGCDATMTGGESLPVSYRERRGLRADASGSLLIAARDPWTASAAGSKGLLRFELDGSEAILPDVAKAILQSDHARTRILEGLLPGLRGAGGDGVIFDWQALRPSFVPAYLELVREAGRRLRPLGYKVALHLPDGSPVLRKRHLLTDIAPHIDHFFYTPAPQSGQLVPGTAGARAKGKRKKKSEGSAPSSVRPPAPLVGVAETVRALQDVTDFLPAGKTWLCLYPAAVLAKGEEALQRFSPQDARRLAYLEGAPIQRDHGHELAWFRCTSREGGGSVWLEDLWSLARKAEIVSQMKLQGLALWELGGHFPEVWDYLHEHYRIVNDWE